MLFNTVTSLNKRWSLVFPNSDGRWYAPRSWNPGRCISQFFFRHSFLKAWPGLGRIYWNSNKTDFKETSDQKCKLRFQTLFVTDLAWLNVEVCRHPSFVCVCDFRLLWVTVTSCWMQTMRPALCLMGNTAPRALDRRHLTPKTLKRCKAASKKKIKNTNKIERNMCRMFVEVLISRLFI